MNAFKSRTAFLTSAGALIAAALAAPGCGVSTPSWNSLQVWGRVTYNGEPVKAGTLIFQPGQLSKSNWGIGFISEDGKYKLASSETDVYLEPGRFLIYIRPPEPSVDRRRRRFEDENESDEKAVFIALTYPVPKRFLTPEGSDLWIDLQKEPTRVDIDLKDR